MNHFCTFASLNFSKKYVMAQKPSIPKGTRDFTPQVMSRRNYIFNVIRQVFEKYGYQPIETPAMENLTTLLGKYGEEGDKLLFKILNSGNFLSKIDKNSLLNPDVSKLSSHIAQKGLRYDLTVPFARFVVQHRNDITFPFKRYQIQPVWRADRPQKGRYREFYQCDVDVIGSNSFLNELDLVRMIDNIFKQLNVNIIIKINNRKLLSGIAHLLGYPEKLVDITTAIDKLDKIGVENVFNELKTKGLDDDAIAQLEPIINLNSENQKKLQCLKELLGSTAEGSQGILELQELLNFIENVSLNAKIEIDQTLARGLNYYTGTIIEVKAADVQIGSICGGGRYDNLTGIFGLPGVSGVGVSFGADRIYDVMNELNLFPDKNLVFTKLLIVNFGYKETLFCLPLLEKLQNAGIKTELFPDNVKMKKQLKYANQKNIPYVLLVGDKELKTGKYSLKNMFSGEQWQLSENEVISHLIKN